MSRLIKHKEKQPAKIENRGKPIFICRCGLTGNKRGLCDGSHQITQDEEEGKLYFYDKNLKRIAFS